ILKTHRNKALIRKQIYDNMEKIIFYNYLPIDVKKIYKLSYYYEYLTYNLSKSVILELFNINKEKLLKNYSRESLNESSDFVEEKSLDFISIRVNMEDLRNFLIDLIKINEISLAKKVFDISIEYLNNNKHFDL